MMRRGIQPLNQPEAAPRRVPPADSVGELARFPLVRWIVGEVAAWASGALGLGSEVAAALRAADMDGEALASLTEHDMQALGIEPFGKRRRLTLRVADSRGAAIGGNASPAVATGPDGATKAAEPRPPASPPPPHLQQSPIGERRYHVPLRCGGGPAASKDATDVASDSRGRDG